MCRPASVRLQIGCLRGGDGLLPGVQKKDAPCLWSALLGVVLSSYLRALEYQTVRWFFCTGVAF